MLNGLRAVESLTEFGVGLRQFGGLYDLTITVLQKKDDCTCASCDYWVHFKGYGG